MLIFDTRGRCFVRTQHELGVTEALKVHKINPPPQTLPQKTVVYPEKV